jgi:putative hydrolase of HD superfamily
MQPTQAPDRAFADLRRFSMCGAGLTEPLLQESRIPYGLKEVYRFSNLAHRKESDCDHTGSMHTLARWLVRTHCLSFDVARMTDMISMHDLHELISGDTPIIPGTEYQVGKHQREEEAAHALARRMSPQESEYYLEIIEEYKQGGTELSKFVRGVDKLEADIQCLTCRADWEGWSEEFYRQKRAPYYQALPILNTYYEQLLSYLRAKKYFSPETSSSAGCVNIPKEDDAFAKLLEELLIPFSLKEVERQARVGERKESVMEHVGSAIMLARFFMRKLEIDLDVAKVADLLIMHDLHEAECGDMPLSSPRRGTEYKDTVERPAIRKLAQRLSPQHAAAYLSIMDEYETQETRESKFVHAVDALDGGLQCLSNKEQWRGWTEGFYRSKRDALMRNVPELMPFYEELVKYLRENDYFSG